MSKHYVFFASSRAKLSHRFSYATSKIRRLQSCREESEVENILSEPSEETLGSWYNSLAMISDENPTLKNYVRGLLQILCVSARPLSFGELRQLFTYQNLKLDSQFDRANSFDLLQNCLRVSSDLLAFSPSEMAATIPLVVESMCSLDLLHPDLKAILLMVSLDARDTQVYTFAETEAHLHMNMAESCLKHLLSFTEPVGAFERDVHAIYPLLQYAARFWYIHFRRTKTVILEDMIYDLFSSEPCLANWLSVYDPDEEERERPRSQHPSPLYYACLLGLGDLARRMLLQGAKFDQVAGKHSYPLLAAVVSGHTSLVRLLLDEKDNANRAFRSGESAMLRALVQGDSDIVKLLLRNGATPETRDKKCLTPLHWAVIKEFVEIAEELISSGADINARDIEGRNALFFTLKIENADLFDLLITNGINVSEPDQYGDTVLHHATRSLDLISMSRLWTAGARVDEQN